METKSVSQCVRVRFGMLSLPATFVLQSKPTAPGALCYYDTVLCNFDCLTSHMCQSDKRQSHKANVGGKRQCISMFECYTSYRWITNIIFILLFLTFYQDKKVITYHNKIKDESLIKKYGESRIRNNTNWIYDLKIHKLKI